MSSSKHSEWLVIGLLVAGIATSTRADIEPVKGLDDDDIEQVQESEEHLEEANAASKAAMDSVRQSVRQVHEMKAQLKSQLAGVKDAIKIAQAAALPDIPEPPEFYDDDGGEAKVDFQFDGWPGPVNFFGGPGSVGQPLIVRTRTADAKAGTNLQEDLNVMSRILNKVTGRGAGRDKRDVAMGLVISGFPGSRRASSMYLEGYGAVFLLDVRYPLVGSPAKEEEKTEPAKDETWEEAKAELYGPGDGDRVFVMSHPGPAQEFDAEKVEALKKDLIQSLKNATNIRDLKLDESITICVTGSTEGGPVVVGKKGAKGKGPAIQRFAFERRTGKLMGDRGQQKQTTMVLQAKKSDVDAFATGKLQLDDFSKRVSVQAYGG